MDELQRRVDAINVPPHIGRIPTKISSGFPGFTAEQWKSWTVIYSPVVLRDILPDDHYQMLAHFSLACSLLCRPFITRSEINRGDEALMQFCEAFQWIFGHSKVTPNMHLHGHLRDCLFNMGPVYSFWCFSFERYNGILENMQKNWISPEIQFMKKFVMLQALSVVDLPSSVSKDILRCYNEMNKGHNAFTEHVTVIDSKILLSHERNIFCHPNRICSLKLPCHELIQPVGEKLFTANTRDLLYKVYMILYDPSSIIHIPMKYEEVYQVQAFNKLYSSLKSRSCRSAGIAAFWPGPIGHVICNHTPVEEDVRIGVVDYYLQHVPKLHSIEGVVEEQPHLFAKVKWFQEHPRKFWIKIGTTIAANLFDQETETSLIPFSRILSTCALVSNSLSLDFGEDKVTIGIPFTRRIHI